MIPHKFCFNALRHGNINIRALNYLFSHQNSVIYILKDFVIQYNWHVLQYTKYTIFILVYINT